MKALVPSWLAVFFYIPALAWSLPPPATITIAGWEYPPLINQAGEGIIGDIYRAAFQAVELDAEMRVLPVRRVPVLFADNKVDAMASLHRSDKLDSLRPPRFSPVLNLIPCWFFLTKAIDDPRKSTVLKTSKAIA
ncbi:MAG: hypothetical protein V7629_01850 [Motiliproteus sp.]